MLCDGGFNVSLLNPVFRFFCSGPSFCVGSINQSSVIGASLFVCLYVNHFIIQNTVLSVSNFGVFIFS